MLNWPLAGLEADASLTTYPSAHHRQAIDAFHSMGFGMINIDARRDFSPGPDLPRKIEVRRAGR